MRLALALIILLLAAGAYAAEIPKTSYAPGELVVIRTTPGATGLAIRFGDQTYRFLGAPEGTTAFSPSAPGEYIVQETLIDGAIIETSFTVALPGSGIDSGPPIADGATPLGNESSGVTDGAMVTVTARPKVDTPTLERDERTLNAVNPGIRVRTGRGTGVAASFTVRPESGGLLKGSTDDLGARLPSGKAEISFDLPERHVTKLTLRGVDMMRPVDVGVDDVPEGFVDVPFQGKAWQTVYAIDPTMVSFTDGEFRANATGTELYKCATWDFDARACPGTWEKLMDIVPGEEYTVALGTGDPGFAEANAQPGIVGATHLTSMRVTGSIPSPVETTANEWGAVVFNPTNRTINVTRISFRASANMFGGATGVVPATTWSSAANLVNWSGQVTVDPWDAAEFIVNVQGVSVNLANVNIEVNATTNDTDLSTSGYETYTRNAAIQYPSVYFANATGRATYVARNLSPDEVESFIVTVDNAAGASAVALASSLVIYLPAEWRNVSANAQAGWTLGTISGEEGAGWVLRPQVATTTIGAGAARNFTFSATPPDRDGTSVYRTYSLFLGPASNQNIAISSSFVPALQARNLSTGLLDADDDRYATTWTAGGSRSVDQYLAVPAPFDSVAASTWGVAVVNPTDNPIDVSQIDIQTSSNVFSAVTPVHPAATWSVASASNVRWAGTVTVPPHSARSFAVNITATAASTLTTTVTYTTVTNVSTLTTSGLITSMSTGNIQYPSLFAMNATGPTFTLMNMSPGRSEQFRIRVSNRGSSAAIPIGTALEIYTPSGWTDLTANTQAGWTIVDVHAGSTGGGIVRAIVSGSTIGTTSSRDFVFNATPPYVGTNSTYRFDILFFGETGQTNTQIMRSVLQLAAVVTPGAYGISLNRTSEPLIDRQNISSITIMDIVKANRSAVFTLSILNVSSGAFTTLRTGTLGTSEENWNGTIAMNRTSDPRQYVDATTGTVKIRWMTSSANMTSLDEDYLTINATYDTLPPVIAQTSPDDASYWNITALVFSYDASDDTDLRNCSILINGTLNQTNSSPSNTSTNNFTVAVVANGVRTWDVVCYDLNDHLNRTGNRTFTVDTVFPGAYLNAPANNTKYTVTTVDFTIVPNDLNIANCSIVIAGTVNQTNTTPVSGQPGIFSVDLPDGNTTWTAECADLAGNIRRNASSRNVQVDTHPPAYAAIAIVPVSGGTYNASQPYAFSVNWTDANGISRVIFESNATGTLANLTVNLTAGATYTYNLSTLGAGTYAWRMYANDTFGSWNATPPQTYIVGKAQANITLILNGTQQNYPVDVNETVNMTALLVAPPSGIVDLYVNGTLYASGASPLQNITSFSQQGSYNVTATYNATANHTASSRSLRVTVGDKLGPAITHLFPGNGSYANTTTIVFRFNLSDATGIENCTLYVNGTANQTNTTKMTNGQVNNITASGFGVGTYSYQVWCYDTVENLRNGTNTTFSVDLTIPAAFSLLTPANGTTSANQSPTLAWTASSDAHLGNYTVYIDNADDFSTPNYIYNTSATSHPLPDVLITETAWYWKVVAYDLAGNGMDSGAYVYRTDTIPPLMTVVRPGNGTYLNATLVNVTYWFADFSDVANCTLAFNDTTSYVNATVDQAGNNTFLPSKAEGTYAWTLACTDIAGNANATDPAILTVDVTPPTEVTLISPPNNTYSNNATPTLDWSQTTEANFENYTVLVSDAQAFPYANHSYLITGIATTLYDVIAPWGDGVWYWKVIAYDLAGNAADPFFTYTIDATPPTEFNLLTPGNNTASTNATPTLTWQQSDDANFANYTVMASSDPTFTLVNHTYIVADSANTTLEVPSPWLGDTRWYWKVIAWDNATNSRESADAFLYITDGQAPVVTQIYPPDQYTHVSNSSSLITFTYNASDLSDIANCTLTINESGTLTMYDDPFITKGEDETFTISLANGNYNWSVACMDAAGNIGGTTRRAIAVNVTLPRLRFYDTAQYDAPRGNTSRNLTAVAVYTSTDGSGTSFPKYRNWTGSGWSGQGELASAGSPVRWVKLAVSPKLGTWNETIAVTLSNDGNLDAYVWNGTAWTVTNDVGSVGTTSNADRAYDIEYETQRGRAMLIYSVDTTNVNRDLAYRIWNGTGWTTEAYIDDTSSTADMRIGYIRTARDPGSNAIAAAYIDATNSDARALLWDGTSWGSPVNITTAVAITTEEDIGIAYESQRRGVLAVAGQGSLIAYAYYNGTAWNQTGTTDINPSATGTVNFIALKANPDGDEILIADVDSGSDLSTAQWAGSTWTGAVRHDATIDSNAGRAFDIGWEQAGDAAIMAWATNAGQVAYKTYAVLSSWGGQNNVGMGVNAHRWIALRTVDGPAGDAMVLGAVAEITALDIGSVVWNGNIPLITNANSLTGSGNTITYQEYDVLPHKYPATVSDERNITLNRSTDAANVVTFPSNGLALLTNATSPTLSNYSARGMYLPRGASATFSATMSAMNPGVSYLTWAAYKVNASGEYLLCRKGNMTRGSEDTQVSGTAETAYTGSCSVTQDWVLAPTESIRAYTYVNSSVNNLITKHIDSATTYVEFEGYLLGDLAATVVFPTTDPLISEGQNLTFICQVACTGGYCLNVQATHQVNTTLSTYGDTGYFDGNILLNASAANPVIFGTMNDTSNATFNLTGNSYSFNNSLRCNVTSDFVNITTDPVNASVLDTTPPNVTLVSPSPGEGFDPGLVAFQVNASDRRLGLCTLWGNWTGTWAQNETVVPNNYTVTDLTPVDVSAYGTYKWNVNCSDLAGNDAFAPANGTFVIAGDLYVNATDINFSPASPVEGQNVTIFATVRNRANRNEGAFNVSFWLGDPDAGGSQMGENITVPSLLALHNVTVNTTFLAITGNTTYTVIVDPPYGAGAIFESDETNNRADTTLFVTIWQVFHGNATGNVTLGTLGNATFVSWQILNNTGRIYIADTDTANGVQFAQLRPLGRDASQGTSATTLDDFAEVDTLLATQDAPDGVNATYTSGGVPIATATFTIFGSPVPNVPIVNSSTGGNFTTGVLWDADDSGNGYYDAADREDLVFVTDVRMGLQGAYGVSDYEIRIPAKMKDYRGSTSTVTFYYEIA